MWSNIIWGFSGIAISFVMVRWRVQIIDFTGLWGWPERVLGSGGTYTLFVLIAILIFFMSCAKLAGRLDDMVGGSVSKFF